MKNIGITISLCITLSIVSSAFGLTTFTPRLSVSEEVTDNLYLTKRNTLEDSITIPSIDLELAMTGRSSGAMLSYNPSYSFYKNYSDNNALRQAANLNVWSDISRTTRLELSNNFLKTEDPLSAEDSPFFVAERPGSTPDGTRPNTDFTNRFGRYHYYRNTAMAGFRHQFGQTDSFSVAYEHSILENKDPTIDDYERHRPSANLEYWLNTRWGTETAVAFENGIFETSDDFNITTGRFRLIRVFTQHFQSFLQYSHSVMDYEGESEDYNIYHPALGINWTMDRNTNVSVSAGYYFRDMEESETDSGWTLEGNIGKQWTFRRSYLTLNGSSGYDQAFFNSENLGFTKYYLISGAAGYEFTRFINTDIRGSYRRAKFEDLAERRIDIIPTISFGINYQITQWLSSRLSYTVRSIDSTNDSEEYVENRGMLMIRISPVQPYRL